MTKTTSLLAVLAVAFGSATALAQNPAGSPADPSTNQNQQPGPSADNPADPATGSDPAARVPTSPPGTGESAPATEGMGTGEAGADAPASEQLTPGTKAPSDQNPAAGTPSDRY
ncbi:hypothetical protein [Hyphomicrobium sp. CS1GBMeth3]|uniref:hypothetical protein n=1 Tax=Hyphomicrobium sp. CS1GBMeth3 TaxID=1892845 RepID=UPI00093113D4|nr:hypothetical protein [Hyphomicrobium sp. CS1GBMeth3]